jgi:hypothetical protein
MKPISNKHIRFKPDSTIHDELEGCDRALLIKPLHTQTFENDKRIMHNSYPFYHPAPRV